MATESKRDDGPEPRPFWSGTITFGLVSVPVDLYPAVRSNRVSLRMLSADGTPLKRRYFCSGDGKMLGADDIVRGYERDDGSFVVVTDEELEALEPRKSRDIDLRLFVERGEIPLGLLERTYLLAPGGESTKAYHLLAETMELTGRAGIATFVMRETEYLTAIFAEGGLLRAATLRFIDELRSPVDVGLPEIRPAPPKLKREVKAALKKLAKKHLDRDLLRDEDASALLALVEQKRSKSRDVVEAPESELEDEEELANVIDIMSVLKRRMQADESARRGAAPQADDLDEKSKKELYELAQVLHVPGRSNMSKDELIAAIRTAA